MKRDKINKVYGKKPVKTAGKNVKTKSNMPVLLKNSFILTKAMHRTYSKATFRIFHKKWSRMVLLLAFILLTAGILVTFGLHLIIPGILLLVAGLYCVGMSRFGYLFGSWREYRNFQEYFGPLVEMEVEFLPKYFRIKTEKGYREFLYSQIVRRIELTNMSILIVGADGMIVHGQVIDKKAFEPMELNKYYDILEEAGVLIS